MRLFRISNLLVIALATFFGVLLFWTSQAVQDKENTLHAINKKLAQEEDTVRVLSVEWDYLNRPQRLEKLAKEQLGMALPSTKELVRNVSEIPEPLLFDEGVVQTISYEEEAATPAPVAVKKETIVSPSTAEKQSFDKLIQSLDAGGGQ